MKCKMKKKLPIKVGDFFVDHFFGGGSHPYFGVWERRGRVPACLCLRLSEGRGRSIEKIDR